MVGTDKPGLTRRNLLIAGGAGVGLVVAWAAWPRAERSGLNLNPGEHLFNNYVKIGTDGHVTVVVPQVEMGQGVYTSLPQIIADELGAEWRTIAVEPAPVGGDYANILFAREAGFTDGFGRAAQTIVTGGSTSVRNYESVLRNAGAAARALLCMAAAKRWDADWRACDTAGGFVVRGDDRIRFGDVAAEASVFAVPRDIAWRSGRENRLTGVSMPRLDLPSKVDGTVNYAGDVRLPDMVYASIALGPIGATRLKTLDKAAANRIAGLLSIVETDDWVAALANTWWVANRAIAALKPVFETTGGTIGNRTIDRALDAAFETGTRIAAVGDVGAAFRGQQIVTAEYRTMLAAHASIEPMAATAQVRDGRLQLWIGTQAPELAARAAAEAIGLDMAAVTVHPMMIGGSFGRRIEVAIAAQVAVIADRIKRPVQLVYSRAQDTQQDVFRPPSVARMSARVAPGGRVDGWLAKIAVPATLDEVHARNWLGKDAQAAIRDTADVSNAVAVAGSVPPYNFANYAIDHHPVSIGVPTGDWRGRAHVLTAFFNECFIDELASVAGIDPFSMRMAALGGNPRLARCLTRVTALGGWNGGVAGSGQGIACHTMADSCIAVLAEAEASGSDTITVRRLFAVVDCGRVINPDIVRQQIIGGLIFGMAAATGGRIDVRRGTVEQERIGALGIPRLADMPQIEIELLQSAAPPGGVGELAVPPVAPAIANALYAKTGQRHRTLPLANA